MQNFILRKYLKKIIILTCNIIQFFTVIVANEPKQAICANSKKIFKFIQYLLITFSFQVVNDRCTYVTYKVYSLRCFHSRRSQRTSSHIFKVFLSLYIPPTMANNSTVPNEILLPFVVFKFIAIIIGALGNITIIVYTIFLGKEKTATSYLVGNLALVDLLVCLTFYPIWIIEFIQTILNIDSDQDLFCKLSRSTIWALLFASVATLLALTVDRYLYIVKPLKYPLIVTRRRVFLAIAGIWLTVCCLFILFLFYWRRFDSKLRSVCLIISYNFFLLMNVFIICLPLILIFTLNFRILNIARKQRRQIFAETAVTVNTTNEQSSKKLIGLHRFRVGLKAAKTFLIVVVMLAFCVFIPTAIGVTIEHFCSESCRQIWYVVFNYEFYGINSIVNAFIYGMRHIKYRKAYGNILFKILRCNQLTN